MFTIIDKSEDNWCTLEWDEEGTKMMVHCEDDTRHPMTMSDVLCTRGKYEGYKMSEISDSNYLTWVQGANLDDEFIQLICRIRLNQLK